MTGSSTHNGRLRFRDNSLKVGEAAYDLRDKLLETKGVVEVEINKRVGSLLVFFDKVKTSIGKILESIGLSLGLPMDRVHKGLSKTSMALRTPKARRFTKRGLILTGAVTIGALPFYEKAHIVGGTVYLGFIGLHLFQNKRSLFK